MDDYNIKWKKFLNKEDFKDPDAEILYVDWYDFTWNVDNEFYIVFTPRRFSQPGLKKMKIDVGEFEDEVWEVTGPYGPIHSPKGYVVDHDGNKYKITSDDAIDILDEWGDAHIGRIEYKEEEKIDWDGPDDEIEADMDLNEEITKRGHLSLKKLQSIAYAYSTIDQGWEPEHDIEGANKEVEDFEQSYPEEAAIIQSMTAYEEYGGPGDEPPYAEEAIRSLLGYTWEEIQRD